jgi:CRP-like cAMP-binding protein
MADKDAHIENRILAALPRAEYNRLLPDLQRVSLGEAQVLNNDGDTISAVYFPNDSVISLFCGTPDHSRVVLDAVGREGMVGIPLALGHRMTSHGAIVQHAGSAMKMMAGPLRKNLAPGRRLQRLLFCNIHARLSQATQSLACDRFHTVEARLASWLLLTQGRVGSSQFRGTQTCISNALRVRRERLNVAAGSLQKRDLIQYSRGCIQILDRNRLEATACACYAIHNQRCVAYLGAEAP